MEREGYGFISGEGGEDVFVHHSDIEGGGFPSLRENRQVEIGVEESCEGLRAVAVRAW